MLTKVKGFFVDTLIFGVHFLIWSTLLVTFGATFAHVTGLGNRIREWLKV